MPRPDYSLGSTVDFKFTTRNFSTGAPFTLAGSPVISAYPDNSTTQLTAGITLTVDFDGVTGLNNIRVVATTGNGYLSGSNYTLVITTGTVNSVSVVGECVGEFSLEAQSPLRPTTAGRTLDVAATGEAGLDFDNIKDATGSHTLTNITVPVVTTVGTLTTYTGNTVQTGDAYARIGAAGVSLSAIPDEAGVTTLLSRLSAARAGYLDNVNNAALQTTVAQTGNVYPLVDTEMATLVTAAAAIQAKTDLLPASPAAVGSAMTLTSGERTSIADATRARQLTESYAADGVAPTLEQAVFAIMQGVLEFGIVGTTLSVRKLDKATAAQTFTLDSATAPTSRTRAT